MEGQRCSFSVFYPLSVIYSNLPYGIDPVRYGNIPYYSNTKGVRRGGGGESGVGVNPAIRIRVWLPGPETSS